MRRGSEPVLGDGDLHLLAQGLADRHRILVAQARRELPDEAFIPTRLVLEPKAFDEIASSLAEPAPATPALRELMRGPRR